MTYRLGDILLELRDPNTTKQRVDEIVRELNELGDREERYRNILTLRGIIVENVETPDGSVRIAPGQFALGNGVRPGEGYSGIRMEYPPFQMNGEEWNLAGVENDTLQFGVRASDGKAVAGGGAVLLDQDGILIPYGGDAVQFTEAGQQWYGVLSMADGILRLIRFNVVAETNLISNGDFETGDLTNWTETDPDSKISVQQESDGNYYLKIANGVYTVNYIQQNLSSSKNKIVVSFRVRTSSGAALRLLTNSAFEVPTVYVGTFWKTIIVFLENATAMTYLNIGATGSDLDIDDIVVRELGSVASLEMTEDIRIGSDDVFFGKAPFVYNSVTDGYFTNVGGFTMQTMSADVSGTVNDVSAWVYTSILRLNTTSTATVTGIDYDYGAVDAPSNRVIMVVNVGSNNLTLSNENTGSSAENRFSIGSDLVVPAGKGVILWHDTTSSRWRIVAKGF